MPYCRLSTDTCAIRLLECIVLKMTIFDQGYSKRARVKSSNHQRFMKDAIGLLRLETKLVVCGAGLCTLYYGCRNDEMPCAGKARQLDRERPKGLPPSLPPSLPLFPPAHSPTHQEFSTTSITHNSDTLTRSKKSKMYMDASTLPLFCGTFCSGSL